MKPIAVVVGIITHAKRLLVAQRPADKPYSGYWEFPGGKVEEQETEEAALARELSEELAILVTEAHKLFDYTHAYADKTVHLKLFQVKAYEGEIKACENQNLAWVNWTELAKLNLLAGNLGFIDQLQQVLT